MATTVSNFYKGTTKTFSITISVGGVAQDIRADTVEWFVKKNRYDADADAILTVEADVTTSGLSGIALFDLAPADTDIDVTGYFAYFKWTHGTDVYIFGGQDLAVEYPANEVP